MSSSASLSSNRFFGIDLGRLGSQLRRAGEALARSAVARALTPALPVRLQQADGSQSLWQVRGDQFQRMPEAAGTPPVPFNALELPDALYLRRTLVLPRLTDEELASAVALDVASASPFPAGDLVWAHGVRFDDAEKAHANIVLASRRQIDTWLIEGGHAARPGPTPELWAVAGLSSPIVVPGHGEAARATQAARGRRLNLALIGLAALLGGALAVTPTLQLRARAIAAGQAFESLHGRAAPAVAQRDQIVQQAEKATAIRDHLAAQADPVKVLEALTRATPDDAWILSLKVEGLTASLTGNAANAAALMRQLEQMPGAREVRATSAATRRIDGTRESFNIEVRLDPAVFGRLPPTEGAQK